MSIAFMAAGSLTTKLSFFQPRLVPLSRLKKNGVRCFAAATSNSGFPVRYVPKKRADAKPAKGSSSGDNSDEDSCMPTSSVSHLRGRNALGKRSNIRNQKNSARLSGSQENELNHDLETQKMRMRPLEDVGEELKNYNGSIQGQQDHCSQENSSTSEALTYKYVKVLRETFQELQLREKGGQDQWFGPNQGFSSHDVAIDSEYMEASEEVEEIEFSEGSGQVGKGRSKTSSSRQEAKEVAIELLAKRAFTAMELRKKLISKHFPLHIVQAVIDDFLERGLINDRLYAETFSQSRWTSSSWGPRRIKHALLKKGVSQAHAEKAVKLVFEDNEECEQNTNIRLSTSSIEKLYMQTSKQWQRSQNVPHETRKARVIRWLQYRGFDWGIVGIILKKLESEHPP